MRVIAGAFKGRRLASPQWPGLRPTSDRLRETLFDILRERVAGARVLDLYAGTGALGLEALSRGAARVTFVERDPRAVRLIRENLARCGVESGYAISCADAGRRVAAAAGPFDLVLIDPPYAEPDLETVLRLAADVLAPGGLVVLEHARRRAAPPHAGPLTRTRQVAAGDAALAFYKGLPAEPEAGTPLAEADDD